MLELFLCLAASPDTSTSDAEEELFRRIVSEELFQKHCFKRHCSEDLVLKEEFLTTGTSGHPGRPNLQQKKYCLRSTV